MTHVSHVNDVEIVYEPLLNGWGRLGDLRRTTPKALLIDYHGRDLWIAKKNCRIYQGHYYAQTFAIESAKKWAEANSRND